MVEAVVMRVPFMGTRGFPSLVLTSCGPGKEPTLSSLAAGVGGRSCTSAPRGWVVPLPTARCEGCSLLQMTRGEGHDMPVWVDLGML